MSAQLHVLPSAQLQDIPEMLRRLANDIEAGKYGEVVESVVLTSGDSFEVFGFGHADGPTTHYLLGCAMQRLQAPRLSEANR